MTAGPTTVHPHGPIPRFAVSFTADFLLLPSGQPPLSSCRQQPDRGCDRRRFQLLTRHGADAGAWREVGGSCSRSCALLRCTQADTTALTNAYDETLGAVFSAVVDAGGWVWSLWYSWSTPTPAQCAESFRANCAAGNHSEVYQSAMMQEWTNVSGSNMTIVQVSARIPRGLQGGA